MGLIAATLRSDMRSEELALGFVVAGKYVVEEMLGRGGMGAVYRVRHTTTGKPMAMKCMLPGLVYDTELVGRFLREARVMGRLQHRHVVDVLDVGRDGDTLFIVMELLDGKPLSALLSDEELTLEETLIVLLRAMEGVAAAHAVGVIHRDLKPDNIFVCLGASGTLDDPRVLDFGISKLEGPADHQITRTGVALGTPYYMALEQLNGQRDIDARVDVYAMGVILYEAIAGVPPFQGDSVSAIAIRMLTTQPEALSALRPDLPKGLSAVIMNAIARNRDDRPPSMQALMEKLQPFVRTGASRTRTSVPLRVSRHRGPASTSGVRISAHGGGGEHQPVRANGAGRIKVVGLGLAALLGGGVLASLMMQRAPETAPEVPRPPATSHVLEKKSDPPSGTTKPDAGARANDGFSVSGKAVEKLSLPELESHGAPDAGAMRQKRPTAPLPVRPTVTRKSRGMKTEPAVTTAPLEETPPTPSPQPKSDGGTVTGRAGVLGANEF